VLIIIPLNAFFQKEKSNKKKRRKGMGIAHEFNDQVFEGIGIKACIGK